MLIYSKLSWGWSGLCELLGGGELSLNSQVDFSPPLFGFKQKNCFKRKVERIYAKIERKRDNAADPAPQGMMGNLWVFAQARRRPGAPPPGHQLLPQVDISAPSSSSPAQ